MSSFKIPDEIINQFNNKSDSTTLDIYIYPSFEKDNSGNFKLKDVKLNKSITKKNTNSFLELVHRDTVSHRNTEGKNFRIFRRDERVIEDTEMNILFYTEKIKGCSKEEFPNLSNYDYETEVTTETFCDSEFDKFYEFQRITEDNKVDSPITNFRVKLNYENIKDTQIMNKIIKRIKSIC